MHFLNWALRRRGESVGDLDRLPASWREAVLANAAAIVREIDAGTGEAELSRSALRGLTCPVRWLHGDRSAASFRAAARRATRLLPNLTVVSVPDGGHVLQYDQPDAVVNAVVPRADHTLTAPSDRAFGPSPVVHARSSTHRDSSSATAVNSPNP